MKCPKCGGEGKYFKKEKGNSCYVVSLSLCDMCHGSGEIEVTNEEWLNTLPTEEKAEVLNKMTLSCYICGQDGYNENSLHCIFGRCTGKEDIFEWLKQPHKE